MMRRLVFGIRMSFGKWKEPNHKLGGLDDAPDLKNKELDKFRRYFNSAHLYHAGQEHPNFEKHPHDLVTIERNEVTTFLGRLKPEF